MRFPNLSLSGISPTQITAASVELRDLMCQGDEDITVECRIYNNSAPSWSESGTTTWSSVGTSYLGALLDSHVISFGQGNVDGERHRYSFNILTAAKAWANGTQNPAKGLVFKANSTFENQTGDDVKSWYKIFASYNRNNYKPSLSLTYRYGISLNYTSLKMNVGDIKQLSTSAVLGYTPTNYSLRWRSTNSRVATVNATTGQLEAKAPGKVTIRAYFYQDSTIYQDFVLTVNNATTQTSDISSGCVYMIKNVSTGKYLSAQKTTTGSTQVSAETKNEYDGKQLWYVVWSGLGYYMYSLGIKDTASCGQNETMLRANVANSSPTVQSGKTSYSRWNISYNTSNGYYYLTNTYRNNTSLSTNISDNIVDHVSLENESGAARWKFEKIDTATFNNYFTGNYKNQGSHIYIKISADSSLYENNYVDATNMDAVNMWNGISSNVTIYGLNDSVPSSINTFSIKYLGYTPSNPTSNYGATKAYKKVLLGYTEVSLADDFDKVEIYINTHVSSPFASETTDVVIEKVIIHELGHALKLAHPMEPNGLQAVNNARNYYPSNNNILANMNQDNPNYSSNLTACTPKWHDIINLKNKWGG